MAVLGWAHLPIFGQVIFSQIHFQFLEIKHPLFAVLCLLLLQSTAYCYVVFFLHFPFSLTLSFFPFPNDDEILLIQFSSVDYSHFFSSSARHSPICTWICFTSRIRGKRNPHCTTTRSKGTTRKVRYLNQDTFPSPFNLSLYLCQSINDLIQSLGYKTENTDWTVRQ